MTSAAVTARYDAGPVEHGVREAQIQRLQPRYRRERLRRGVSQMQSVLDGVEARQQAGLAGDLQARRMPKRHAVPSDIAAAGADMLPVRRRLRCKDLAVVVERKSHARAHGDRQATGISPPKSSNVVLIGVGMHRPLYVLLRCRTPASMDRAVRAPHPLLLPPESSRLHPRLLDREPVRGRQECAQVPEPLARPPTDRLRPVAAPMTAT